MKSELELLRTLAKVEEDVVNGRAAPIQDTFDNIRKSLSERKNDEKIVTVYATVDGRQRKL